MARRELTPAQLAVVQAVRAFVDRQVLVACSGGPDSTALALAAAYVAERAGVRIRAGIIDHGLQDGSDVVAAQASARLSGRGLSCQVLRVEVGEGPSLEAAARQARHRGLAQLAQGDPVLLGHTLDDQAETVLLGLARGSGVRSLAGMAPISVRDGVELRRPLLGLHRATTVHACVGWGIETWADPQNLVEDFTRVRVRRSVLPLLDEYLGPGIPEALARTATLARADADLLDHLARELAGQAVGEAGVDVEVLAKAPDALSGRVLLGWLRQGGVVEPGFTHLRAVRSLIDDWHGQKGIDLPGGLCVVRRGGTLVLERSARSSGDQGRF